MKGYHINIFYSEEDDPESSHSDAQPTIGDLILILDENLEVIDENWFINVRSPYVLAI